jgi:hypothetical protein
VSWQTKKQSTVALSSAEAELMSLVEVAKEILFFKHVLTQLRYNIILPICINVDNQSAIKIAEHDVFRDRTKHIDIKHHFLHDCINDKIIKLVWKESKLEIADIFTKPISTDLFTQHRAKLLSAISSS